MSRQADNRRKERMAEPKRVSGKVCPRCQNYLIEGRGGVACATCHWQEGDSEEPEAFEWDAEAGRAKVPAKALGPREVRLEDAQRRAAEQRRGEAIADGNIAAQTMSAEEWFVHEALEEAELAGDGRPLSDDAARKAVEAHLGRQGKSPEREKAAARTYERARLTAGLEGRSAPAARAPEPTAPKPPAPAAKP